MRRMVISYAVDGTVEHILKDSFFKPGEANQPRLIKRVSEVKPSPDGRTFYIKFKMGKWRDKYFSAKLDMELFNGEIKLEQTFYNELKAQGVEFAFEERPLHWAKTGKVYHFPDYETAVKWEIAIVNELRRQGYTFG